LESLFETRRREPIAEQPNWIVHKNGENCVIWSANFLEFWIEENACHPTLLNEH
jgi:hypothetical protein